MLFLRRFAMRTCGVSAAGLGSNFGAGDEDEQPIATRVVRRATVGGSAEGLPVPQAPPLVPPAIGGTTVDVQR